MTPEEREKLKAEAREWLATIAIEEDADTASLADLLERLIHDAVAERDERERKLREALEVWNQAESLPDCAACGALDASLPDDAPRESGAKR